MPCIILTTCYHVDNLEQRDISLFNLLLFQVVIYVVARPGRELLFTVVTQDEKYKAKVCRNFHIVLLVHFLFFSSFFCSSLCLFKNNSQRRDKYTQVGTRTGDRMNNEFIV